MYCVQFFDTEAIPSLIRKEALLMEWLDAIRAIAQPSWRSATNQNVLIVGSVLLHVRIEDARVSGVSGAVKIADTSITEEILHGKIRYRVFPLEHKVVLYNYAPVSIIAALVKKNNEKDQNLQEGDSFKEVLIVDDKYEAPRFIRRKGKQKSSLTWRAQY